MGPTEVRLVVTCGPINSSCSTTCASSATCCCSSFRTEKHGYSDSQRQCKDVPQFASSKALLSGCFQFVPVLSGSFHYKSHGFPRTKQCCVHSFGKHRLQGTSIESKTHWTKLVHGLCMPSPTVIVPPNRFEIGFIGWTWGDIEQQHTKAATVRLGQSVANGYAETASLPCNCTP